MYQQPEMNPNTSEQHEMNFNAPEYYYPGNFNRQQQPQYYPQQPQPYPPRQRCRWIYCCEPYRPPYGGYGDSYGG